MNWTVSVLIICVLFAVFAVWKEYKRPAKAHLIWRILASLIAITALACIILPVNYSKEIIHVNENTAVLLTNGFVADSLNNYQNDKLLTIDREISQKYPKAKLIRLNELKTDSPAISSLRIFGNGLNASELDELDHLPVVFHPAEQPAGITHIGWNQKLHAGEQLQIQGTYKNDRSQSVKLSLKGLNTELDTAIIPAKSTKEFEVSTVPKNEGRAVYHLFAIAGVDTIENQPVPVEIDPIKPIKILLLTASPDFETKFLKSWLAENGFQIAARSVISKNKYSSEFTNMQPLKLDHLNASTLGQFDLVIGDLSVLKSESELKQEVMQNGLGLIIRADTILKTLSWLQNDFPVDHFQVKDTPVPLVVQNKKGKTAGLKPGSTFIRYKAGTQPLVNNVQSRIVTSSALAGAGKLIFATLNTTYNWMLAGDKDDYAAYWTLLISSSARKVPVTGKWSVQSRFAIPGGPISLQLASTSVPTGISSGQSMIAPSQNPLVPFEWENIYWPPSSGWHAIQQNTGKPAWFYIFGRQDWQRVKASEKINATTHYADNYGYAANVTKPIHEKVQIEMPKIYFYLLLLISCVYLWVEGKM